MYYILYVRTLLVTHETIHSLALILRVLSIGGAGTGSLYEDVWVLPAPTASTGVAKAQNHEYLLQPILV